jgi:hypothetical protein
LGSKSHQKNSFLGSEDLLQFQLLLLVYQYFVSTSSFSLWSYGWPGLLLALLSLTMKGFQRVRDADPRTLVVVVHEDCIVFRGAVLYPDLVLMGTSLPFEWLHPGDMDGLDGPVIDLDFH